MILKYIKSIITYEEFGRMMNQLVDHLKTVPNKFDYIYGPPKGAWPIITHLANHLKIECLSSEGFCETLDKEIKNYLIADDIVDKGQTLGNIHGYEFENKYCPRPYYVSLFYKPQSTFKPDYYVKKIPNEIWVVFPWERYDEEPNR